MINRLFPLKMTVGPTGRSPKFLWGERAARSLHSLLVLLTRRVSNFLTLN
jgi:hypothetical protein